VLPVLSVLVMWTAWLLICEKCKFSSVERPVVHYLTSVCMHVLAHKKQTPEEEAWILLLTRIFFVSLICVEIERDVLSH
jgi:hypothetical protein